MEQLIDRISKASTGLKIGVVAAVAAAVVALNYFVVGVPTFGKSIQEYETRIARADAEQKKLNDDLIDKTSIANNLNQFRREKELLEQKLSEALSELPEDKQVDELLKLFQDRAVKAGLEIALIEPQAPATEGFYARIPIPMAVTGNFHEIATFFDSLGRLKRIVNVNNITLDTPKDVGGKVVLSGKFLVTSFMFVDPKQQKPKPGGAK